MDIAVSSASNRFARVDGEGMVSVSSLTSGQALDCFPILHSIGGKRLALASDGTLFSADYEEGVCAYAVPGGEQLWKNKRRSVQTLIVDPANPHLFAVTDRDISVLDPTSGVELSRIRGWGHLWPSTAGLWVVARKRSWGPLGPDWAKPWWTKRTRSSFGVLAAASGPAGICVSEGADEDWNVGDALFQGVTHLARTSCFSVDGSPLWARESEVGSHVLEVAWCEDAGFWALLEQNYHTSKPSRVVAVDVGGTIVSETRLQEPGYRARFSVDGTYLVTDASVYRVLDMTADSASRG